MTTINDRKFTLTFNGLTSTAVTASVILVVGLTGHEILKRRKRRFPADGRDRGAEAYSMGYLYRARSFVPVNPTPDFGKWPLAWLWTTSYKLPEKFYETHCGPDATVYVRFLRTVFFWSMLQTCTTFPILLAIHYTESTGEPAGSLERASLKSLAQSPNGKRLLWVHVVMVWWMSISWFCALFWLGYGAVRIRRNCLRTLLGKSEAGAELHEKVAPALAPEPRPADPRDERPIGWRFRTVLMRNIGPAMRSETALRDYFESHLRRKTPSPSSDDLSVAYPPAQEKKLDSSESPLISDIIIVRKATELNELFIKYKATLYELESAHCALAENTMNFVKAKVEEEERIRTGARSKRRPLARIAHLFGKKEEAVSEDVERLAREGDARLVEALRGFLPGGSPPLDAAGEPVSLWTALHDLNATPTLLDRFQPLFKLKRFHGQRVPSIDYHLAKVNLLITLIEDKRAHPEQFEAAPTAFITFEKASDARRARTELKWLPGGKVFAGKIFECKIKRAPEVRDLQWERLALVSLSADIVRSILLQVSIWAATIFWIIPLSFLISLISLSSINKYIPKLATALESNSLSRTLFSSLLPTSIVSLLSMLVPTLISIATRNGQALVTVSKLNTICQARYWRWLVINIIIVFVVGATAFRAALNAFQSPESVLTVIASAFPTGATFFVSWTLLVVGLHHGIEILLLGIPFINHASIRKLKAPRKRESEALPRFFNYAYWVPNHLLVFAVTAIFAILNPLVIAFNAFYQVFALATFKNGHAHVYWRRNFELNSRWIFPRIYSYSLDIIVLAQVVAIAFIWVLKEFRLGGACIPLIPVTVFVKIVGRRWFNLLMNEIDELEIDLVCDDAAEIKDLSVPLTETDPDLHHLKPREVFSTVKSFALTTLPALTFRPDELLPPVPSPHQHTNHIRPRSNSRATIVRRTPRSRTNSGRHQVRSTASMDDDRPILALSPSRESTISSHDLHDLGNRLSPAKAPSRAAAVGSGRLDLLAFSKGETPDSSHPASLLVTPHPPVVRDDRPCTNVRYDNPAQVAELARSLWLPRDPLYPCDLGDTIDYHGRVLVSSEGGGGILGSWDEHLTEDEDEVEAELGQQALVMKLSLKRATSKVSLDTNTLGRRPTGRERIRVAGDVAAKIEAEEGVSAGRRRGSSGAISLPPSSPSLQQRRGTGTSTLGADSPSLEPSEPHNANPASPPSPTFQLRPLPRQKSSPRIPAFTDEPETLAPPASGGSDAVAVSGSSTAGYFPPTSPSPSRATTPHSTLRRRPSHTDEGPPLSPSSLSPPHATTPRSPTLQRTRRGRSPSAAMSMQPSIAEVAEEGEVYISQAAALRNELLEEEREDHEKREQKEEARRKKEHGDRKGGWLTRLLLEAAPEEVKPGA